LSLVLFWLSSIALAANPARAQPPNLVFILVDDLRWDELGCMGHPFALTPHVDRLAREGSRFTNAFATTPLCSPSRASYLTGQYPHHHGITDNTARDAQSHRLVTFPALLQKAGYRTGFIGKWHMGNDDSPRPGFDEWIALSGQGTSYDPQLNRNGKISPSKGYTTDLLIEDSLKFLKREDPRPFLLYLSHKGLHPELIQHADGSLSDPSAARFIPAKRHESLYKQAKVPRRPNVQDTLEGKPALQRPIAGLPPLSAHTGTSDESVRDRQRMLASIDEGVGAIHAALEASKRLDSTLIVFTSDHGYFYGEHGLSTERRLAYEETIRVPLIMRYPPLFRAGSTISPIVISLDLGPTLLELGQAPIPSNLDGRSILPLLREETRKLHDSFLIEHSSDQVFPRVANMGYIAIRTDRWKYIQYRDLKGMDELYDLSADPYELKNLIHDPTHTETLSTLQAELRRQAR